MLAPWHPPWGGLKTLTDKTIEVFLSLFLLFVCPPPKPNALCSSCHHAKHLPFDGISIPELGRVGVCVGCDFVNFVNSRWNPCCDSRVGSFALLALSGHSWAWHHAAFPWLSARGLWQPGYHTRYKRGSNMSCGVCTYNSGHAGCSGWIAVHIEYSEAEKQCEGIRPQHKNT